MLIFKEFAKILPNHYKNTQKTISPCVKPVFCEVFAMATNGAFLRVLGFFGYFLVRMWHTGFKSLWG